MAPHFLVFVISLAFLASCGPKTLPPASPLDSAPNHYERGMASLEQGDLFTAQREFERARALNPNFPGALVGNALVAMKQQDFWRARKQVALAIHKDSDFVDAYIAQGRIIAEEGTQRDYPAKEWLEEALRSFRKAEQKNAEYPAIYYYQGLVYLKALDLVTARQSFTRVLEGNRGPLVAKALAQVERIQMIERGAPGSEIGLKIALVPRVSRAELAVLLLEELNLGEIVRQRRGRVAETEFQPLQEAEKKPDTREPTDISGTWAEPWIQEVLELAISGLEVFPDNTFRPDQPLTRANYALANQGVLVLLTGNPSVTTKYIGEATRFPDVRSDLYAYNAIALNTERGIMSADKISGHFRPNDPVSGAEALLIIRELQNAFRMEF